MVFFYQLIGCLLFNNLVDRVHDVGDFALNVGQDLEVTTDAL